jgi:crotonobetainyl-CoA:carnitine CoA-transferase CaiB-like acyl-CoA transferase
MNAFGAAVTAYFGALVQDEGDWVDISLQECAAGMLELYGPGSAFMHTGPQMRMGNHVRAVWAIYPCLDGYAGVCCLERQVPALFRLLGLENDERFRDPTVRAEHDDELTAIMYGWFGERTKQEVLAESPIHKIPFGAVLTPSDLLANPNLKARGMFDTIHTPDGEARVPGRPFLGVPWHVGELQDVTTAGAVLAEWEAAR